LDKSTIAILCGSSSGAVLSYFPPCQLNLLPSPNGLYQVIPFGPLIVLQASRFAFLLFVFSWTIYASVINGPFP